MDADPATTDVPLVTVALRVRFGGDASESDITAILGAAPGESKVGDPAVGGDRVIRVMSDVANFDVDECLSEALSTIESFMEELNSLHKTVPSVDLVVEVAVRFRRTTPALVVETETLNRLRQLSLSVRYDLQYQADWDGPIVPLG